MSFRADLDSLLLYDPARSRSTVNVWVARPNGPDEAAWGKLFLITAIQTPAHVNHQIVSILQDEFRHQFYQSAGLTLERRFEETLQGVNRRLHALIADGVNEWLPNAQLLAGVLHQNHLLLSPVRGVHAYVLRGSRLHDILGVTDDAPPNPLRIFSQVITGQIEVDDRLLFCLPSLLDYFSLEKLRRTLLDHSPSEAARLLEQSLVDVDPSMSFGALMVAVRDEPEVSPVTIPQQPRLVSNQRHAPQRSMDDLIGTERATEQIMAPSIWPALRAMGSSIGRGLDRLVRMVMKQPPRRRLLNSRSSVQSPAERRIGTQGSWADQPKRWLALAGRNIARLIMLIPRRLPSWPRSSAVPLTPFARPSFGQRLLSWWQRTNSRQRWVMASVLAVVIVLFSLLARGTPPASSTATTQSASIESELSRAEAALLYGGESVAREAAASAEAKLATLPTKRKADKELRQQLATRLAAVKQQLAHQIVMSGGETMVDFATQSNASQPTQLYATNRHLVAHDPARQLTTIIDRGTGQVQRAATTLDVGNLLTGTVINNMVVFVTDRPGLIELNPATNTWKPFDATFPTPRPTVQGLTAFQNRIYLLDREHHRILRFTRGSSSYGGSISWLKDSVTLADSRDITIDGSVFLLRPNGLVEEYFGGRKSSFTLGSVDPRLRNATRLWTNAGSQSLYVLDPEHRRVVIYQKNGQLRQQLTETAWNNLRDLAIDEAGHVLFILNGSTVIRYQLPTS